MKIRDLIKTNYAYKIDYYINLPGLIVPNFMKGQIVTINGTKKLRISPLDNTPIPYPHQTSPYTVVEPMRIADFMDLQYRAAESLTETNRVVNELLNDKMISDLTTSVSNFRVQAILLLFHRHQFQTLKSLPHKQLLHLKKQTNL